MDSTSYFITRIDLLQKKVDSLTAMSLMDQANFRLTQQDSIISQVDAFYYSAWVKVILTITFFGIVVPIIVGYLQKRSLNDLRELILKQVKDSYDVTIAELKTSNKEDIAAATKEYSEKLEQVTLKSRYRAETNLHHLQGLTFGTMGKRFDSFIHHLIACRYSLRLADFDTAQVSIKNATKALESIATKIQFEEGVSSSPGRNYLRTISYLKEADKTNIFADSLLHIENYINNLK